MKRLLAAAFAAVCLSILPVAAQPAQMNAPQVAVPAPGPAVGISRVGAPTFVVPAGESRGGVIDVGQAFGWLAPYVNSAVGMLITAGLGWLGTLLHKKFNIDIDAGARDALTTFLQRQAASLVADGAVKVNGLQIEVHNPSVAKAANEALAAVPGALKRFGITPDKVSQVVGDMIVDYIHRVPAVAAASSPAPAPSPAPKAAA